MKKNIFNKLSLKERFLRLLNKEGFYVAIFLGITIIATTVVYFTSNNIIGNRADGGDENIVATDEHDVDEVSKGIDEETEIDESVNEDAEEQDAEEIENKEIQEDAEGNNSESSQSNSSGEILNEIINPVDSNDVVMAFSMGGHPVYSKTLQVFTSDHSGTDIKADIGTEVKSALDGKVIGIRMDSKLGQTIVIQHSNGVETRYSNLDKDVAVTKNQNVKAGQVIGKVGETSTFESAEEPHLHFEIWKDGKAVDPEEYLN